MIRRHPGRSGRCSGGILAELLLLTPVLLIFTLGGAELTWTAYTYHFVQTAACEGASFAMARGAACTRGMADCPATPNEIQDYVRALAPGAISSAAITTTTVWTPNRKPGSSVRVTVMYPVFDLEIPSQPPASLSVQSSCSMVISQ